MFYSDPTDTICALSTPSGMGAIALIRITGPATFSVCAQIFRPATHTFSIDQGNPYTIHRGQIIKANELIDEVLISLFRSPHSYTGEDIIEITCHGSVYIQQQILELLIEKGCRLAKPGEFTLRAFLNGKYDLSQAEAVADLISSESKTAHDVALHQMRGGFSRKITELRNKLLEFTSLLELELDFSEEDVEFVSRPELLLLLDEIQTELTSLIHSFSLGNVIKKGIPVTIIGKPNVGKSTLLNALLNEEKAIVSEIPGTTRDAIEDTIVIEGFIFRFIDTAGLRDSRDVIESIGIERTWEKIRAATIILYLFDATSDSYETVSEAIREFSELCDDSSKRFLLIGNKIDLVSELPKGFQEFVAHETIFISAKRKENIHAIAESLVRSVQLTTIDHEAIITNSRHLEALQRALSALISVQEGMQTGLSPDLLTVDIRQILQHLGEITGEITTDEILTHIFERFCIGK